MGCTGSKSDDGTGGSSVLTKKEDLHALCQRRDINRIKRVLDTEPERINELDFDGLTPLLIASYKGFSDVVSLLLEKGAGIGIDLCDKDGRTALHRALHWGHVEVAMLLLSAGGANLNTLKDASDKTCLETAKSNKKINPEQCLQLVKCREEIEKDLQPYLTAAKDGPLVALMSCCDKRKKLYEKNALVTSALDFKDNEGRSALFIAAEAGKLQHVQALIEKGAYLEAEVPLTKETPVIVAAKNGHLEVAQFLINSGAQGKRRDAKNMHAFDYIPVDLKPYKEDSKIPSRLGPSNSPPPPPPPPSRR